MLLIIIIRLRLLTLLTFLKCCTTFIKRQKAVTICQALAYYSRLLLIYKPFSSTITLLLRDLITKTIVTLLLLLNLAQRSLTLIRRSQLLILALATTLLLQLSTLGFALISLSLISVTTLTGIRRLISHSVILLKSTLQLKISQISCKLKINLDVKKYLL